jgi:hypothetical protein
VALGDRTLWVLDAYTTTSMYPYSQSTSGEQGLASDFNYVRNSVKATVDAYDGTVTFYVFDPKDPIIQSWRKAFPDLFTDASNISKELRAHLRYPEDLFKVQSNQFGRYHVTEPRRFYDGSAKWLVSPDPGSGAVSATDFGALIDSGSSDTSASAQPQAATSTGRRIDPYYLYLKLPKEDSEHFIVTTPFVPVSSANSITRLVSFLTANSDPGHYGELRAFTMPQGETVRGPVQVNNDISRTNAISQSVTLLNTQGSRVTQGSLQLIPVGDSSLIYVRPFYVQGRQSGSFPQFQFVVVYSQGLGAVCAPTVSEGLDLLFSGASQATCTGVTIPGSGTGGTGSSTTTTTTPGSSTTTPGPTTTTVPAPSGSVRDLLNQAAAKFQQADVALQAGDLGTYQTLEKQGRDLVSQAQAAARNQ